MTAAARSMNPAPSAAFSHQNRSGRGGIYQATKLLEKKHGAFFISRLILASGISLRGYDSNSPDDPVTVTKFIKTVRNMLSPSDMADLLTQNPSLNSAK